MRKELWKEIQRELGLSNGAEARRMESVFESLETVPHPVLPSGARSRLMTRLNADREPALPPAMEVAQPPRSLWGLLITSGRFAFDRGFHLVGGLVLLSSLLLSGVLAEASISVLAVSAGALVLVQMFYALRSLFSGMWELEQTCPLSAGQLLLGKLLYALVMQLVAGLAVATGLTLVGITTGVLPAFLHWAAVSVFLTGLVLVISLHFGATGGLISGLTFWVVGFMDSLSPRGLGIFRLETARFTSVFWDLSPFELALGVLGVALILYVVYRVVRFEGRELAHLLKEGV